MKHKSAVYFACVGLAVLILGLPFLVEVIPPQPEHYVSDHSTSNVPPMWGFAADSVFNTGDAKELDTFPGVGEVISQRIVDGRDALDGYRIPEDLLLVKGIGEKTLEKIMDALEEPLVELSPLEE